MKKLKLILFSLLLCFGVVYVSACKEETPVVLAENVYLTETSVELTLGDFATIGVSITPEEATSKDFEVSALTKDIVTIDYDKENMQFTINAPNTITNGFNTVELEVKATDGSDANAHITVTLKERITLIDAPEYLHYNESAGQLEWAEVINANAYQLNINGTDLPPVYTNHFVLDSSYVGQDIVAKVCAIAEDGSKSEYAEHSFKILSAPTNLTYNDGTISWDEVEDATKYYVYFDGKIESCDFTQLYILDRFSEAKIYQIKVMAVGDDTQSNIADSSFSEVLEITKLDLPKNIRIANGEILWESVENNSGYKIYLDNNAPFVTGYNKYTLPHSLSAGVHTFKIATCGNENTYISSFVSSALSFEKLQPVSQLYIENGQVCWTPNLQATSYMLYVNGAPYQTTNIDVCSVDFADYNSGTYSLNIKAIGNGGNILDSDLMMQGLSATKLATPTNLHIEKQNNQNFVVWDSVDYATAYLVAINNEDPFVINQNQYLLQVEAGAYNIKVMALGDSQQFINSNYSSMFVSTKLNDVSGLTVVDGEICWNMVAGAGKYQVLINNEKLIETTNNRFDLQSSQEDIFEAGIYTISVKAIASSQSNMDSNYCDNISVTKLSVPQVAVNFGALVDAQVANSSRIEYKITIINNLGETVNVQTKNTLAGFGSQTYQQFNIVAKAYASTANQGEIMYVNSDTSSVFSCIQLPQVTDISMSNGIAYFAENTYQDLTEGFTFEMEVVNIDDTDVLTNTTVHTLQSTQREYNFTTFNAGNYTYKFTAKPNCNSNGESLLTVPYLTSKTSTESSVIVLDAPNNAKISTIADTIKTVTDLFLSAQSLYNSKSGELVWDKVENATKYTISIDGVERYTTTATSCDLIGILADDGLEHQITVKAIGNNTNIITSLATEQIACKKLKRATNITCDGESILWQSEYNTGFNLMSLTSPTVNIVAFVAVINGKKYVTLNTDGLSFTNIAQRLCSKAYEIPKLDYEEYVAKIYAIPLNAYVTVGGEVMSTTGTQYVVSEMSTNDLYFSNLYTPQGLEMNCVDDKQMLSWSPLKYENGEVAEYVVCQIVGDEVQEFSVPYNVTEWQFKNYMPNTYHFTVYAKAQKNSYYEKDGKRYYYINSNYSDFVETTVSEVPSLFVNAGKVNWSEVTGALKYELTFGKAGGAQEVRLFEPSITQFELGEEYNSGNYTFKIRAIGDGSEYITSEFSTLYTFTKLDVIKNLRLDNGIIRYDQNTTVASEINDCYYQLIINGKAKSNQKLVATELEGYAGGSYTLFVYAFGDNDKYLTSNISDSITVTKLSYPASMSLNNGILTWSNANNASSYSLDIAGSIVTDIVGVSYDCTGLECGDHSIKVKAIGNSTLYVNSDWTKPTVISKLDEIKDLRVENGVITWKKVEGKYKDIRLKIKASTDANYTEIKIDGDKTNYVLDNSYVAGLYDVCMYNAGGSFAISSSVTQVLKVNKLEVPANLRITTQNAEQYLEFDPIANAISYTLVISFNSGNNKQNVEFTVNTTKISTNTLNEDYISITTSGTYILTVRANGTILSGIESATNKFVNSDYSSKLTITKPEAPVLVDVKTKTGMSSGMVIWDAVADADYYRVKMTFDKKDKNDNTIEIIKEFTTTETCIYVENKANYTIQVTACKDFNGFDSETSEITLSYALFDGSGTQEDPYRIKNAEDFNNIIYNLTACYQLVDNIDFTDNALVEISTEQKPLIGVIDGNNYQITGVSLMTYNSVVGLVPVVGETGVVKNVILNVDITTGQTVGGISAINNGTIENCVVNGTVSPIHNVVATVLNAGGIVGINNGKVLNCVNNATINPQNNMNITYAGGIVGYNNGLISGCGNNGSVSATYAGGITAYTIGNISYSYNNFNGVVTATTFNNSITCYAYAGGIVGYAQSSTTDGVSIYTCYNVGSVVAISQYNAIYPYAGGIIGYNSGAKVENCYSAGVDNNGNITISVTTNNNGRGYAGILVGFNEKGTISQANVSIYVNSSQIDANTNSGFINRIRFIYDIIDEYTILNNLYSDTYEESSGNYPTIVNAKY